MRPLALLPLCLALAAPSAERPKGVLRVPVWLDDRNSQMEPLSAGSLRARLDAAPARIVGVLGPDQHLMLVLVLDLTEDLSLAELAKQALEAQLHKLASGAHVGLMRAQDGLRVLVDPTAQPDPLIRAIRELPISGKAGLLESLPAALRLTDAVLAKAAVRAGLLYVTDSNVYNYREDYINPVVNYSDRHDLSRRFPESLVKERIARLERQVSTFQTPLFIVHLNYRSDRLNEAYQTGLMQLAAGSGGASQFCRSRQEVPEAIAAMFQRVAQLYRVDVELPERRGKLVALQLEGPAGPLVYRNRFVLE